MWGLDNNWADTVENRGSGHVILERNVKDAKDSKRKKTKIEAMEEAWQTRSLDE